MSEDYPKTAKKRKPTKEVVLTEDLIDRYRASVDKRGPNECWEWTGGVIPQGYGRIWGGNCDYRAVRVAYAIEHGQTPVDKFVLHKCDNPPCVNPAHLRLGTSQENTDDAKERTRHKYGARHPKSKLTAVDVGEIREALASGRFSGAELAARFSVSAGLIGRIGRGDSWKHLPALGTQGVRRGERCKTAKLTEDKVREMRERYDAGGVSLLALGLEYGVSPRVVARVVKRQAWNHIK